VFLPAVIIALVAGAGEGAGRRARLHELGNRLGLGREKETGGLRGRLEEAYRRWLPGMGSFDVANDYQAALGILFLEILVTEEQWRESTYEFVPMLHGAAVGPVPHIVRVKLPVGRGSHGWEDWVPWVARETARSMQAATSKAECDRIVASMRGFRYIFTELDDWREATHPDLMSMTWEEVMIASRAWHGTFVSETSFGKPVNPGIVLMSWPDGMTLERLVTARQLEQEGSSMGHCVGGYWSKVRDGSDIILSLRGADRVPVATVEIAPTYDDPTPRGSIIQIRGPRNGEITEALARRRLAIWLATAGVGDMESDESTFRDLLGDDIGVGAYPPTMDPDILLADWFSEEEVAKRAKRRAAFGPRTVAEGEFLESWMGRFIPGPSGNARDIQDLKAALDAVQEARDRLIGDTADEMELVDIVHAGPGSEAWHWWVEDMGDPEENPESRLSVLRDILIQEDWSDLMRTAKEEAETISSLFPGSFKEKRADEGLLWEMGPDEYTTDVRISMRTTDWDNEVRWSVSTWHRAFHGNGYWETAGSSEHGMYDALIDAGVLVPAVKMASALLALKKDLGTRTPLDTPVARLSPLVDFLEEAKAAGVVLDRDAERFLRKRI
jgi:hypothetical protein